MSQDVTTLAKTPVAKARPAKVAAPVRREAAPKIQGDQLKVSPKASTEVPGEDIRNQVSLTGTVLGPVVTAKQTVGMLANASFKNPMLGHIGKLAGKVAAAAGKVRFLSNPIVTGGLKTISRGLPFIGLGLLGFDGFATVKTFMNPEASGLRKGLTLGRFVFNAIGTAVSFIPGAGFVYSLAPSLVGNGFEIAMAKLNAGKGSK